MAHVFLTGATGFVGRHLAARLEAEGHRLTCLVQNTASPAAERLGLLGAELTAGNILDREAVIRGARGCEVVIHLVGIIFERRGASFEQIHVHGTANALAAAQAAGCRRFLHMSALGTGAPGRQRLSPHQVARGRGGAGQRA